MKPQFDPAGAFMTLRALEARSTVDTVARVRAEGELGVQRDTQDFRFGLYMRGGGGICADQLAF